MNKAEKFLRQWYDKKYPDLKGYNRDWISSDVIDLMQQYAQQERKKYAVDFVRDFTYKIPRHLIEVEYDDWLNQQEGER